MKFKAYAKINLFLRVLYKRKDGYHEIETLFERINLFDTITLVTKKSGIQIVASDKNLPTGPKNSAYQAAHLLQKECKVRRGVLIKIQKRIPVSAGLGGGSSDAAAVLVGLNRLWKLGLSRPKLMRLAAKLGSDVPFFVLGTPFAIGRGRGEILRKINAPGGKIWHCLVKPPFGISTKMAYQALRTSVLTPKKADVRMLLHSIQKGHSEPLPKLLTNSLEETLNNRVMTIFKIKKNLVRLGASACLMSGSGPSVFGIYPSKAKAFLAARFLKKMNKNWQVFAVSTF